MNNRVNQQRSNLAVTFISHTHQQHYLQSLYQIVDTVPPYILIYKHDIYFYSHLNPLLHPQTTKNTSDKNCI